MYSELTHYTDQYTRQQYTNIGRVLICFHIGLKSDKILKKTWGTFFGGENQYLVQSSSTFRKYNYFDGQ